MLARPASFKDRSIVILGGTSSVGRRLHETFAASGNRVYATHRRRVDNAADGIFVDLNDETSWKNIPGADWTVILGAESQFSACASDPSRTAKVNTLAPVEITRRQNERGGRVLFFSTMAVFGEYGSTPLSETEKPVPNSDYGRQKLEAELGILNISEESIVLRPSKIISPSFPLFEKWIAALRNNLPITPFSDLLAAPVWIDAIVDVSIELMSKNTAQGRYHAGSKDAVSYLDIARFFSSALRLTSPDLQTALARETLPRNARWVPENPVPDCTRLTQETGFVPPSAIVSLEKYFQSRSISARQ